MKGLILCFDAPLMSFGGVKVDQYYITNSFPGLSLFTGLIANALGLSRTDGDKINMLQDKLIVASRWDIEPETIVDYQTVDLGQSKMRRKGWTTTGEPEYRKGGPSARTGTHLCYKYYHANGVLVSVIALNGVGWPTLDEIAYALQFPSRPLFIGRKTCLPSKPILVGQSDGENILTILQSVKRCKRKEQKHSSNMLACWPTGLSNEHQGQINSVYDHRDWNNQLHTGNRLVTNGIIKEA